VNLKRRITTFAIAALSVAALPFLASYSNINPLASDASLITAVETIRANAPKAATIKYGFVLDSFAVVSDVVKPHQSLSDLLTDYGVAAADISTLVANAATTFDVKKIKTGQDYLLLNDAKTQQPQFLVYEPDVYRYIVFDLATQTASEVRRQVDVKLETVAADVKDNLWNTAEANNMDDKLVDKMQDATKHSFDFHKIKRGDKFKLVYEHVYVEDKPVDIGDLKALYFEKDNKSYYAYRYTSKGESEYYDGDGRPYKQGFLQAPVKSSRVSSHYNLNRLHPILGYVRAHTGTDYAAPLGSPIVSVADGVIEQAAPGGGKGNFVKIRHNSTYETEYYHMMRFATGIRPGKVVQQGDVIGYVGMTGLTNGPHVCFHFWKNGKQVDHLKEKLPRADPLAKAELTNFMALRDSLTTQLNSTEFVATNKKPHP
jgi:murein DD-endopeptidase MepM/ murein hydrolase activator NlpD